LFVRAPSGRKRFNWGSLNAITHEVITVTNDSYINALSVCELLQKSAALVLRIPITLILDNARYQKCQLVQDLAASLRIELLYLPKMLLLPVCQGNCAIAGSAFFDFDLHLFPQLKLTCGLLNRLFY
jgi:DDE superfamily endonuclease